MAKRPISYYSEFSKVLSAKKKPAALNRIKNSTNFTTLCEICDRLTKVIKPLNFTFFGNPFPKKLEDLGKGEMLFKPISLENEFKWTFLTLRKFNKKISLFLILKKDFEKYILIGDYDKAEIVLGTIVEEFGYSVWYIEAKFLLLEYQNKPEEQKEFLSKINSKNKNLFIGTLSHFLSFRTEKNLSAYKYDYDIKSLFSRSKKDDEREVRQYYSFRLNYFENYNLDDYSILLVFENCNSLIDRYLLMREVLKVLALKKSNHEFVYSKAIYIYRKIGDNHLLPLIFQKEMKSFPNNFFNLEYLKNFDLYYSGLYDEAIEEIKKYLVKDPSNFDLIVLFIRCHINQNKELQPIHYNKESLLNQISLKVFNLMSSGVNRSEVLYNLYQIGKNILTFEISPSLNNFLKREENIFVDEKLKILSFDKFDPYYCKIFENEKIGVEYLKNGLKFSENSVTINQWIKYLQNEEQDKNVLSKEIYLMNKAKILFNYGEYENSIQEWNNILIEFKNNIPIIQTTIKYLFDCYYQLKDYNIAIKLFVNEYIENENSVVKVNSFNLLNQLKKQRFTGVKRSIDLPIFVFLCSNDDAEKSYILEEFCKIYNANLPSELFDSINENDPRKVEFFYSMVCGSEILKHSIYLNKTIERLNERLTIVNFLKDNFNATDKYIDELNLISNELIVYEGTIKLDESKIYANDQAIINNELKDIDGLYNRFKTIYKLSLKDKKILVIAENSYALIKFNGLENYNKTEVKYSESALIDVFSELFDSILDRYLFSNYGIVAYLSTRIRHGVLLGELRPELEKQNLILNRIGETNKYEKSKFWNSKYFSLDERKKDELHNILSNFSLNIDNLIEEIIKTKIQIKKNGKNENGLFNYEFDKQELSTIINTIPIELDTKGYCQQIIEILWQRTDANLEVIREYIDIDIKNKFSEELNKLDKDLHVIFKDDDLPVIFTNVVESSTIIENKIKKISSWFRRSGSTINDFDIKKVFDIVWNNTKKCYPKTEVECKVSINSNSIFRSSYYIHFTDLFRILLDNMFKYGETRGGVKNVEFKCEEKDDKLWLTFKNDLANSEFEREFPFKTNEFGHLIVDKGRLLSEGNSGLSKAIKIVKYDFDNENNMIEVTTNENKFILIVAVDFKNLIQHEKDTNC